MNELSRWANEEMGRADLGQGARTTRAVAMLAQMAATPAGTVSGVFTVPAAREGAYRWLENPAVTVHDVDAALHASCARRCREHALVIVPIDGSSLAHTDTRGDDGVGSVGTHTAGARGLKSMIAIPLSYDGVPLGVGAHVLWARPLTRHPTPHEKRALKDKESRYWTTLQHEFERTLADEGAVTTPWYQIDREGDAKHVHLRGLTPGPLFTVRGNHNRLLHASSAQRAHRRLHDALQGPPIGVMYLHVGPGKNRIERVARLEVRVAHVELKLREQWSHRALGNVPITAVRVTETHAPSGAEPIEWLLLTNWPVTGFDEAVRVARAYALRWTIERVHYTWKSGTCHVEDAQLESFPALAKWAALHLSVAVHRQHLLHLSRTQPELPADEAFDRDEIDAALTLYTQHRADGPAPGSTPTLGTLVEIIARLGGYTGKSSGGPAGIKVFQRGLERVEIVALAFRLQRERSRPPTSTDGFG